MRTLVVLRPEPGASQTIERATRHGLAALHIPLFRVEPVSWSVPDLSGFDGVLFTSANALRHGGPKLAGLRPLRAYAVGEATAAAARQAGFEVVATGAGGVDELLATIDRDLRLLHLCGEDRRAPNAPQSLTPVVAYRSATIERPDGLEQLAGTVVLVHSPRAGRRLAELAPDPAHVMVAGISPAAAAACGSGWARSEASAMPDDDALLSLAERLCKDSPAS